MEEKKPFGRPTKYQPDFVQKANDYIDISEIPYIEELALMLDVDDTTLLNWAEKHEDFFAAIKKLRTKQKFELQKKGLTKDVNPVMAIFQLKCNHDMVETQRNISEQSGTIKIIREYVDEPTEGDIS